MVEYSTAQHSTAKRCTASCRIESIVFTVVWKRHHITHRHVVEPRSIQGIHIGEEIRPSIRTHSGLQQSRVLRRDESPLLLAGG